MKTILFPVLLALTLCAACASQPLVRATRSPAAQTDPPPNAAACRGLSAQIADRDITERATNGGLKLKYDKKEADRTAALNAASDPMYAGTSSETAGDRPAKDEMAMAGMGSDRALKEGATPGGMAMGAADAKSKDRAAMHSAMEYDMALKAAQSSRAEWGIAIKKFAADMNCNITHEIAALYSANPLPPAFD